MSDELSVPRYSIVGRYGGAYEAQGTETGEWVRWTDVQQAHHGHVTSLIAAREALRDEVERRINDALSLRETNRALSRQVRDLMALLVGEK